MTQREKIEEILKTSIGISALYGNDMKAGQIQKLTAESIDQIETLITEDMIDELERLQAREMQLRNSPAIKKLLSELRASLKGNSDGK